jgi:hypothetical protein
MHLPNFGSAVLLASVGIVVAGASGCAAKGAAGAARFPEEPEPTTVEEAQAQVDRARARIDASGLPPVATGTVTPAAPATAAPAGPAGGATAPTSPTPLSQAAPTQAEAAAEASKSAEEQESNVGSVCDTACHAIASMRRAVGAICRLAGPQDEKCTQAKKTLSDEEARVAGCGC